MNFEFLFFLSVKTIETNLLRKYYLQVTTNDEKTFLFPLFSTDIKSTGYQNQNSQIVSYKFVYIFCTTVRSLQAGMQRNCEELLKQLSVSLG